MQSSLTLQTSAARGAPTRSSPAPSPEPNPAALGPAAVRLGAELLRLGRYSEADTVLQRVLACRDPRDRGTLLRSLLYLAEGARASGKRHHAVEHYSELLAYAERFGRWDHVALAHAGLGLCLLEERRLDEAQDEWAYARAAMGSHLEWFDHREILEIFIARLQVLSGALELAEERLALAAAALDGVDRARWAEVELERVLVLAEMDPRAARALLEKLASSVAEADSPPLRARIEAVERIVADMISDGARRS